MHRLPTWMAHYIKKIVLICKVVVKVQRSHIIFIYMGVPNLTKTKLIILFLLSNFVKFSMKTSFSFHVILIFIALSLFLLCAMERQESCMLSVNRTCLFHGDLFFKSVFSLALMGYVDNLYFTSVSMC